MALEIQSLTLYSHASANFLTHRLLFLKYTVKLMALSTALPLEIHDARQFVRGL